MRLFINTGGKGTRLYPLTKDMPKPMVEICGKPVLLHLVEWAKKYGIKEIVMMNGFRADVVQDYFGDGSKFGVTIFHSNEPYPLGSGGPISFAKKYINGRFAYISGDHLCEVDFHKMITFHQDKNADMSILVHKSSHPHDSDILQLNDDSKVVKFVSKHDDHAGAGDLSNSGLCIIEPKIVELMDKEVFNFENYIYPKVLEKGWKLYGYHSEEFMADMGTPKRLKKCEDHLKKSLGDSYHRVLVTGAGGMMGSHMMDFLKKKGVTILGTYFNPTTDLNEIPIDVPLRKLDMRDKEKVFEIIKKFKPTKIFHLAAQSYPTVSWQKPAETIDINVNGTIHLFEAVKKLKLNPVIMVACSSAEYGFVEMKDVPITESHPLLPLHPYGVSKVGQDLLTYQYFINDGIKGIRMRIFNTTGPRKVNDVCSDFTKRAVLIEKGLRDGELKENVFRVGNLETQRAITDVRDAINAFWLVTEHGIPGEVYNFSGEKAYLMQDILDTVCKITNITPEIYQDPKFMRPTDEKIIFGDSTKLKEQTGWKQNYTIEQTLKDMIEYWRAIL
jgi:GDP-4-dehydro-6-deoxy-D-mannose reductase